MLTAWKTDKGGNELENTSKWEVEYISTIIDSTWIRLLDENKRIVLDLEKGEYFECYDSMTESVYNYRIIGAYDGAYRVELIERI